MCFKTWRMVLGLQDREAVETSNFCSLQLSQFDLHYKRYTRLPTTHI